MENVNPKKIARIAGFLYLLLLPLGIFGILYVPSTLIAPGDPATTATNIIAHESLFRLSIVSALLVQIVNIAVVLFLYKLLNPVNKSAAWFMVMFLLLGVPIAMLNELNNVAVLLLSSSVDFLPLFLDLHEHGINIAGIFWGLWLFPMGYLVFRSGFLPRFLGVLLIIGGFGYLIDSIMFFLFPNFDVTISQFTFVGEVLLPLWLLLKGVNVKQWEKRALEAA